MDSEWIPIQTIPPLDDNMFSEDLEIKVGGKKMYGYYDAHKEIWHKIYMSEWRSSEIVTPTHWREIKPKNTP